VLFATACDNGVIFACNNLGQHYMRGDAVEKNETKAVELFKRACDVGDPSACRNLGMAYVEGRGVPPGLAPAAVWLRKGCDGADVVACRSLGALLAEGGGGVDRDEDGAKQALGLACRRGDDPACRILVNRGWATLKEPTAAAPTDSTDAGSPPPQ
jgi:TPR repeat protein